MGTDTRVETVAFAMLLELQKIAEAGMAPGMTQGEMDGGGGQMQVQQADEEVVPDEQAPAHGVFGAGIQNLGKNRALGIPKLAPPPGYIYSPENAAFIPAEGDPGWMAQQEAIEAARNRGWYEQGQDDAGVQAAQQEVDATAQAGVDSAMAEEQAMAEQEMLMQQQAMAQQGGAQPQQPQQPGPPAQQGAPKAKKPGGAVTVKVSQ